MERRTAGILITALGLAAAGCATTMHGSQAKSQETDAAKTQVAALETKITELNSRIDELSQRQEFTQTSASAAVRQMARHSTAEGTQAQTKPAAGSTLSAKQTQLALKSAGFYNGPVDGKFGRQTKEAVKAFQRSKGLNPDGVVGSKTAMALAKLASTEAETSTEERQ